jgi:phage FluMu gp28-like protein
MTTAILLPYQQRWSKDPAQVKLWEKSRRIGASYGEAADDVLHAAASTGGGNVYYISYNKDMTSTFVDDCAGWAKRFNSALGSIGESVFKRDDDRDIHVFDIEFASGHHIRTFSNNPRNLRSKGRPGDRVVIDEAAFVDDLEELLKAAMAVTMWGGEVRIMSTHNGDDNPFNTLIADIRAGKFDYSIHRVTLDDAIADGLYRRICQVTGKPWSAESEAEWRAQLVRRYRPNEDEELFCIPAMGGGSYLPRALIERCMPRAEDSAPLVRFNGNAAFNAMPPHMRAADMADWIREHLDPVLAALDGARRHVAGMDFARSGDMTSIVLLEIGADLRRTWRGLIEMHNTPFSEQKQVLHHALRRLPRFSGAALDARGNGQQLAEETVDVFGASLIQAVMPTEAFYRESFPKYKAGLEDRTTILIRHDDVLEDHRAVKIVRGVPRVPEGKTDGKGQRHGDSAIAGLLADVAASADPPDLNTVASAGEREPGRLGLDPAEPSLSAVGFGAVSNGMAEYSYE